MGGGSVYLCWKVVFGVGLRCRLTKPTKANFAYNTGVDSMASEYQIMAMMADLKIQLHAQEALSRQYDNKAKTATGEQKQELKNKANAHRDTAEKLKKDIEALKKRLEEQKQAKSNQIQKYGEVGREAASKEAAQIRQQERIKQINSQQKSH